MKAGKKSDEWHRGGPASAQIPHRMRGAGSSRELIASNDRKYARGARRRSWHPVSKTAQCRHLYRIEQSVMCLGTQSMGDTSLRVSRASQKIIARSRRLEGSLQCPSPDKMKHVKSIKP